MRQLCKAVRRPARRPTRSPDGRSGPPYTYDRAADVLGIQAEAVRARLRRGALRRGPLTNDHRPTVLLSPAEIATIRAGIRTDRPEAGVTHEIPPQSWSEIMR